MPSPALAAAAAADTAAVAADIAIAAAAASKLAPLTHLSGHPQSFLWQKACHEVLYASCAVLELSLCLAGVCPGVAEAHSRVGSSGVWL